MSRIASLLIAVMGTGLVPGFAQPPSVVITPANQQIEQDSTGYVRIRVNNIAHLHAYEVRVSYDPLVVRCRGVLDLGFLGSQTFFSSMIDSVNGLTTLDEASLGPGGQSGSGDLAELTFVGLVHGTTALTLTTADFRDTVNQIISVSTQGAFIRVGPADAIHEPGSTTPRQVRVESYPNPFNPATTVRYFQDRSGDVTLKICSMTGEEVFAREQFSSWAGNHEIVWDGRDRNGRVLPSGAYVINVHTASSSAATKVILLK